MEKERKKERKKVKSLSRVRLFATPWTVAYHAPPSMGFCGQEYWSGVPLPSAEDLPDPGIKLGLPHCRQMLYGLNHQGSQKDGRVRIKYKRNNQTELAGLVAQLGVRGKYQGVLTVDSNIFSLEESVDGDSIEQDKREQRGLSTEGKVELIFFWLCSSWQKDTWSDAVCS